MHGVAGWVLLLGLASGSTEVGTVEVVNLGTVERCSSAVRQGSSVWLGCASGVWRAGPGGLVPVLPCAEEAPGSVVVRPLPPGPSGVACAAATPCGLYFLAPDGPPTPAPLPSAPLALDTDSAGFAWALTDEALWRCRPGAPCRTFAELVELDGEGGRLLALRDGPRLWLAGRLFRPGPTWRQEPAPGPGWRPLAGPAGELLWVDGRGCLVGPGAAGQPGRRTCAPLQAGARLVAAQGFPGGVWLSDLRWFYVWRGRGWQRGPLPPGRGGVVPVAGELTGGVPWLLAGDSLHRPAPAPDPARAWCPPAPAMTRAAIDGPTPGTGEGSARAFLPTLTLVLGGAHGEASASVGGVVAARARTARWALALGLSWPLPELAREAGAEERARLARERREALAERLALAEELAAARDRLCRQRGGPAQRLELAALDEMLAAVNGGGEVP